jgi:outer membrane protein
MTQTLQASLRRTLRTAQQAAVLRATAWLAAAVLGGTACLAASVPLAAQQPAQQQAAEQAAVPSPSVTPLTLADALRLAREHNPSFQRTRNDMHVAAAAVRSAWASFLPSLNTSMSFSGSRSTALTGLDPYGHPVRLDEPRTARGSSASQGVSTSMLLFDGTSNMANLRTQRALHEGTAANIEAQEVQLIAQVSREYYQAVRTTRTIALEAALLESARERLTRTEELLRLAARNRVDVLGARADVAQAEQNLERARGEADKARLSLATEIGIEPTATVTVDTVLPPVFDPAGLDVDRLAAQAVARSPVVRQRTAAAEAARHRAAAARGRRWPTIAANAGYGRSMTMQNYGAFGELNPQNYGFSFGLSGSLPLFSRFQTSAQIADAEAAAQDAEHDVRGARLVAERDVRAAVIDLVNAYRSLRLAEQNAELSRERQDLTQEQYRLGGITFSELQNVIDRTAQAERQALDARFAFITARLNLEARLGSSLDG